MRQRCGPTLVLVVAGLLLSAPPAATDWLGHYFNTIPGTIWTYERIDEPAPAVVDSCFDVHLHEGQTVVRVGDPLENLVVMNTGRVITTYALVAGGVEYDLPEDFALGWFEDGDKLLPCPPVATCDTNLVRLWTAIDPALREVYGLDPAVTDLVVMASYDTLLAPNLHNTILESSLPDGVTPPVGAISGIEWYRARTGLYAKRDVHAATGGLGEFYLLTDFVTAAPDAERPPPLLRLAQNFPNPFNPTTTIRYDLAEPATVALRIYDARVRLARTLVPAGRRAAGAHRCRWNGRDDLGRALPSGTYVYRLTADAASASRRLVLVR